MRRPSLVDRMRPWRRALRHGCFIRINSATLDKARLIPKPRAQAPSPIALPVAILVRFERELAMLIWLFPLLFGLCLWGLLSKAGSVTGNIAGNIAIGGLVLLVLIFGFILAVGAMTAS
jgi:hypothetical protein